MHTPGPWRTSLTDDTAIIAKDRDIASVSGNYDSDADWRVMEANARLIAAAPDLLAALLEYASLMERAAKLHPSRDLREVIGDPKGLAIRTRAAIAKATP